MSYTLAPKIKALTPYDPIMGEYRIRLDANESFLQPTPEDEDKMAYIVRHTQLNRYPDPLATDMCNAFASLYDISPQLVTAGNGSDELLFILTSAFLEAGETILTLQPDFSMYEFYGNLAQAKCLEMKKNENLTIDVDKVIEIINQQNVRMLLFSNPCNPTSLGLTKQNVTRIIENSPNTLIILDEAYMDFWDQSLLSNVDSYNNLIILRTASKALGMAGLRCGFAVTNKKLTGYLRAAKSPYNVGNLTQGLATLIMKNKTYKSEYIPILIASRDMLLMGLKQIPQLKVYDSCTNFAYIKTPHAKQIFEYLKEKGIIIRCFGNQHLRITAGTQEQNTEVIAHINFFVKNLA